MSISVSQEIRASRESVWNIITDIDTWADTISGILSIDVIDRPESGLIGLKWKETRVMFGKEAIETMWISAAEYGRWYETTAENHGMVYSTRLSLDDAEDGVVLTMAFTATPQTVTAKLMSVVGALFNGALRKMLQQDMEDIRQAAESSAAPTSSS
jgi:hypothetical protein